MQSVPGNEKGDGKNLKWNSGFMGIREKSLPSLPFCMARFRDGSSYGGQSKRHASETNYSLIRKFSKFAEKEWFEK